MKKLPFYLVSLLLLPGLLLSSCKDSENEAEPTFETLKTYLVDNDMDLGGIIKYHGADADIKFVAPPPASESDVDAFTDKYYIMDIRSAEDYNAGHVAGAVNVAFPNILTQAENAGDKPILTICYTGQTACYATSLLRLYGHRDAQALKWGMSGWNNSKDKWTPNTGDIADGHENWTTAAAPAPVTFDAPEITESLTEGDAILKARVEAVVANGFKKVSGADVLENPGNYFINNYFSEGDYLGFGHIDGAYRILPLSLADGEIMNLDPSKQVVTYCYTGQTSAVITAYLNVLGYDAYSLMFGMNGLYNSHNHWSSNQWGGDSNPKELPVVTK